jgi:spermidine synthase
MLRALSRVLVGPPLYRRNGIEVRERNGLRTLHLDSDTVQSAMRIDRPDDLELSYTRAMMSFLLFGAPPRKALLIGLGGASLAKYIYRTMPETCVKVVEIHADVIEVARRYFGLPDECRRLSVSVGEGAQHVEALAEAVDVLLVDAYDGQSLAASLATEHFFRAACHALSPHGVFVMNLWANDRAFDSNVQRIETAFRGRCLCLPAERPGNVIVLAFARSPDSDGLRWANLQGRAKLLKERFGLEFPAFVTGLRPMNEHDSRGLIFRGGDV